MATEINKQSLSHYLIYNLPIDYSENIRLVPVTMLHYLDFHFFSPSITVRKNSIFREKVIIKMTYLDFLIHAFNNQELESQYDVKGLSSYYWAACQLLQLCCPGAKISVDEKTAYPIINGELITPQKFDDLRRIIIIQNDIDFDIDEFLNRDTELRLQKAQRDLSNGKETADIEDYVDSLAIALNATEDRIMNMTIRKFWRYVNRYQAHENYTIMKTGECSGMIKFKDPIKHWMSSLEQDDKYKHLKTNEDELRSKIG